MKQGGWKPSASDIIGGLFVVALAIFALGFSVIRLVDPQALSGWGVVGTVAGPVLGVVALLVLRRLILRAVARDAKNLQTESP